MSTTEAQNKDTVQRLHNKIWSEGDLDLVDEIVAEDYVEHNPMVPHEARGPADYKESVTMFRTAFPDLTITEEDTIVEGEKVVTRITMEGTHEGEFMGIEPTGRAVESTGIVINRLQDGQLVESWPLADMLSVLQQLGVVEPPAK